VYSLELVITVCLAATVIGLIVGFLISQKATPSQQNQRQLESHLNDLQQQQESYQSEVTEHFMETAELLNTLTDSYRDVHNHLAKGAQMLAGENASESLKALSDDSSASDSLPEDTNISPPLDYAPKSASNEPGMLNEEFGLDKTLKQTDLNTALAANQNKQA
jgi:uncharacterized protein